MRKGSVVGMTSLTACAFCEVLIIATMAHSRGSHTSSSMWLSRRRAQRAPQYREMFLGEEGSGEQGGEGGVTYQGRSARMMSATRHRKYLVCFCSSEFMSSATWTEIQCIQYMTDTTVTPMTPMTPVIPMIPLTSMTPDAPMTSLTLYSNSQSP